MYITCDQCSTIYRLDEKLLKPTGSKVRCSQCRCVFVAKPPEASLAQVEESHVPAEPSDQLQDTFDQELEGIDLAELDSILEQGKSLELSEDFQDLDMLEESDFLAEFDESDLDMDFESALEQKEDSLAEMEIAVGSEAQSVAEPLVQEADDIDLEMDFDLDDGGQDIIEPIVPEEDLLDVDLDMDFDLEEGGDESTVIQPPEENGLVQEDLSDDAMLEEDVDLALDDFEDVLGGALGKETEDLSSVEFSEEELELDAEFDEKLLQDADDQELEFDMEADRQEVEDELADDELETLEAGDLDDLLDGVEDETDDQIEPERDELYLDDAADVITDEAPESQFDPGEEKDLKSAVEADDDLDVSGLAAFLDEEDEGTNDTDAVSEDVELTLDDDFKLDLDEEAAAEATTGESDTAVAADSEAGGLDLDFDDELRDEEDDQAEAALAEDMELLMEDDDIELTLDEDLAEEDTADGAETEVSAADKGDDLELTGFDELLDEEDDQAEAALAEDMELSLDDDLDLSLGEDADLDIADKSEAVETVNDHDEFDLSDFEDLLTEEADLPESDDNLKASKEFALETNSEPELSSKDHDDFDISDLDGIVDDDDVSKEGQGDDVELSLDDDLELSLDDEPSLEMESGATTKPASVQADEDHFDLSGLDDDLLADDEGEAADDVLGEEIELSLDDADVQLSLDDESLEDAVSEAEEEEDISGLEDLEFEIDAEFEDKQISETADNSGDDEIMEDDQQAEALDLTDIEKMLEDDNIVPDKAHAAEDADLDSTSGGSEKWTSDELISEDDEISLSEIEEAIESASVESDDDISVDEDQYLDLDFDLESDEPESADASEEFELELEMEEDSSDGRESGDEDTDELDLSDFDLAAEDDHSSVQTEIVDGGDIQLEFQIEEGGDQLEDTETLEASLTTAAASATTGFMEAEDDFSVQETIVEEPFVQEKPTVGMAPEPKKIGTNKSLIIMIPILLLLGVGGYFGYDYVVKNNIQIPYLSDYINPQAKDPNGIKQLATMEINSKFIENETAGRIFVITGKVRNGYPTPRKLISLRGKLYTKGKVLAKTEQTYAGLVMTDQELSSISVADIKKRLNSTTGQDSATTIAQGNSAPFIIVFSELPSDLDEFVIELVSSAKVQ